MITASDAARLLSGVSLSALAQCALRAVGAGSGIVGMAGGLGGFLLPIMFGAILDWLGVNSSYFMLLYGIVWVSLTLNYLTEVHRAP